MKEDCFSQSLLVEACSDYSTKLTVGGDQVREKNCLKNTQQGLELYQDRGRCESPMCLLSSCTWLPPALPSSFLNLYSLSFRHLHSLGLHVAHGILSLSDFAANWLTLLDSLCQIFKKGIGFAQIFILSSSIPMADQVTEWLCSSQVSALQSTHLRQEASVQQRA